MSRFIRLIFGILLLGVGAWIVYSHFQSLTTTTSADIEHEALRLSGIAHERTLTLADFETLERITQESEIHHEVEEAQWMVEHGFSEHVGHTLNAIASLAHDGEYICPADSLSHLRPYIEFNEIKLAEHAEAEGKETLNTWVTKVIAAKEKNPAVYPESDALIAEMNATITAFDAGDYNAAKTHAAYLEANGYC